MSDTETVQKMLRAVLQASKGGVPLASLQSQYKSLTGEFIPYKQLGHSSLDSFLHSVPTVVRMERGRAAEVMCHAVVCKETAHMAQLVARQRSSKRTGRPQLVNCQLRVKPAAPFRLNAKPRSSLRQPEQEGLRHAVAHTHTRGQVTMRDTQTNSRVGGATPQGRSLGMQMRKPQTPAEKPDKKVTLPARFQKEVLTHLTRNTHPSSGPVKTRAAPSCNTELVQSRLTELLSKHSNGLWVSRLPQLYLEVYKQDLPSETLTELESWNHICTVEKPCSTKPSELLLYPAVTKPDSPVTHQDATPTHPVGNPPPSATLLSPGTKAKLAELLQKYSHGLWASALPKLYQDTYKTVLPSGALTDLSLLHDISTIDYPVSDNPNKAILYPLVPSQEPEAQSTVGNLVIPKEEYPSVLVVEAASTNSVTMRYIGETYSRAQEALEDEMRVFYKQDDVCKLLSSPVVGQLVAVCAEEEEVLRARVCEVMGDKAKVYYVDHGFSEMLSNSKLSELGDKFYKLPFQATQCRLAGLEAFSCDPDVLKKLETTANGKILLAEIVERADPPLVVLYDTSQEDDVNVNALCLRALQDRSLGPSPQVSGCYTDITVTNVCSDGTVYCQLPSRGQALLAQAQEKMEAHFHSQVTSELLVSRPFCGKLCLAHYKGKWCRVEITNLHGTRVLDVQYVDMGVPESLEVCELREIPPTFLRELISIPAQAVKCCLAGLPVSVGSWTADAVQWLRNAVLTSPSCSIKVSHIDEDKHLLHVYLFSSRGAVESDHSLNHQLAQSDLWKHQKDVFLGTHRKSSLTGSVPVPLCPPPLSLPPPGHNLDVFVSVACHPGHFVLQPWQQQDKLVVLMDEMILHYNRMQGRPVRPEKNQVYAAKVDERWQRVLVKGVLTNGLVSVYELDYGKHELVSSAQLQPLIENFQKLPFQGIKAQLAGVKHQQWSEEASIVFRNHVEKKALVAQVESVAEGPQVWDRKVMVYLVDTSQKERDIWIHEMMSEFAEETKAV